MAPAVRLVIVYRSTGRENAKPRPQWYSKRLCLESFVQAVAASPVPTEVVYLNDGPVGDEVLELMRQTGEVRQIDEGTMAGCYLAGLDAAIAATGRDDLVYIAEDDYLFRPEAFSAVVEAARALAHADYFAFYGTIERWRGASWSVDGTLWRVATTTTLSFAVRASVLKADRRLHDLALRVGFPVDTDLCLAYRGTRPYRWVELAAETLVGVRGVPLTPAQRVRRAVGRGWLNLIAVRRSFRPRRLLVSQPALATHAESAFIAVDFDWDGLAEQVRARASSAVPTAT